MSSLLKKIASALFFLGLLYVLLPGPYSIKDFPPLPNSVKSVLEGDTTQNPNIAAYYSQFDREEITDFYKSKFAGMLVPLIKIPSIKLNHPPEEAYQYVRDQQESTFLEEYIHPLRESIYVNGYEPMIENKIRGVQKKSFIGDRILYQGGAYLSKTTLRFYPTHAVARIIIYLNLWLLTLMLIKLYRKAYK